MAWTRIVPLIAVSVLGTGLLAADAALLVTMYRTEEALVAILGWSVLIYGLFPATVLALAGVIGLVRRRRSGYVWVLLAYGYAFAVELVLLWIFASILDHDFDARPLFEVVAPGLLAAFCLVSILLTAYGLRKAPPSGAADTTPPIDVR